MAITCETCIYWKADTDKTDTTRPLWGECRRQAPRLRFHRNGDDPDSTWPPTTSGDWCGEYRIDAQIGLDLAVAS